jgi:hypothetical protein
MNWNDHSRDILPDHALLAPSGVSWINYTSDTSTMLDKLAQRYASSMRAPAGTAIHDFAANAILMHEKLPKSETAVVKMVKFFMQGKGPKVYNEELINFISTMPKEVIETIIMYVNDCIGYRMDPEVRLVYSYECNGTADAISFDNGLLRISDLKTGDGIVHMEQLFIYAAIFCLEYHFKPKQIKIETRLYQLGNVTEVLDVPAELIESYMNTIVTETKFLQKLRGRE